MKPTRALVLVCLAAMLAGCGPTSIDQGRQTPGTGKEVRTQPNETSPGNQQKTSRIDVVFVHKGALYGIDLLSSTVKELVPVDGSGQKTESAMFASDGKRLLLHRNWVGRDSWWTAKPDGSDLRQLPVMGEQQTGPIARLKDETFVGCFQGEKLVLFDLSGREPLYQELKSDSQCKRNGQMLASPDGITFAYTAPAGVIVATSNDNAIKVLHRVPGQKIFGWLASAALVTGDTSNLYVVSVLTGELKHVSVTSVLPGAEKLTGVTINPTGKSLYITAALKAGGGQTIALDPQALAPITDTPDKRPEDGAGPMAFSPLGTLAVWNVPGSRGVPLVISRSDSGEVLLKTNETTVPVPYVFHPNDTAILYSRPTAQAGEFELHIKDLSGKDRVLWKWDSSDGLGSLDWNPTSSIGE